jgi:uncharacterized protein (TIGR00369 family)
MSPDLLVLGREVLARQAFSALLGARLDVLTPGHAELSLPMAQTLRQQHGFVHGGVLAYLADNALTFAGGSLLGDAVTVEFKINYLRPATEAEELVALASVLGSGKTQAVCRCEVFNVRGDKRTLCAAAQGTIRKLG